MRITGKKILKFLPTILGIAILVFVIMKVFGNKKEGFRKMKKEGFFIADPRGAVISPSLVDSPSDHSKKIYSCTGKKAPNGTPRTKLVDGSGNTPGLSSLNSGVTGATCPAGFHIGARNTLDSDERRFVTCVKDIQMCEDGYNYTPGNTLARRCVPISGHGASTLVKSGAICPGIQSGEKQYISGPYCQIAKLDGPCNPGLVYDRTLHYCVGCVAP